VRVRTLRAHTRRKSACLQALRTTRTGTFRAEPAHMSMGPCAALLDRVGGDEQIFVDLCDAFLDDAPKRLESIRNAILTGDARTVQREAHAYKGSAGAFDAHDVVAAARELEHGAAAGDLAEAHDAWVRLELHSRELLEAVRIGKERG
jgi:HPt (histidine-containing phosphotransfer) domain-containing protein